MTERKQADDARDRAAEVVRQSEQRMRLHVDQTPLAVIEWDLQLCVSKWNPGAERIFGYSAAEALGRHFTFIVPHAMRDSIDRLWAALCARKGGERSTNENVTKDERTILCEWYNTPLVDAEGQVVGFASLAEDITEQKRAEAALRESERRLATVLSNLPGAVYRCKADANWTIEFLSDGYRTLTGCDPSQLIGRSGSCHAQLIHPDDRARELEAMQRAIAEKRHYQVEYRLRTSTGQEKWVWEQGTGVYSESGEWLAIEGFTTDITDRKQAEAALRLAHDELEQRVHERTAALNESNHRLQQEIEERRRTLDALQKSEAKYRALVEELRREQLALRRMVMASDHERRLITYELHDGVAQQLAAAMIQLQLMQPHQGGASAATETTYQELLDTLRKASAELRLVMSRLRTPVLDNFGLAEAIEDVAVQLRSMPGAPEIDYCHAVQFERLEPTLENSLFRIAQEAMTNACRHSQSAKVRVQLLQKGHEVMLEVRDWGIGFDPKMGTENRFGLEGIRARSRLLGGKLRIASQPGQGTIVRVEFPVLELHTPQ